MIKMIYAMVQKILDVKWRPKCETTYSMYLWFCFQIHNSGRPIVKCTEETAHPQLMTGTPVYRETDQRIDNRGSAGLVCLPAGRVVVDSFFSYRDGFEKNWLGYPGRPSLN